MHRLVLADSSAFFSTCFECSFKDSSGPISLEAIDPTTFEACVLASPGHLSYSRTLQQCRALIETYEIRHGLRFTYIIHHNGSPR